MGPHGNDGRDKLGHGQAADKLCNPDGVPYLMYVSYDSELGGLGFNLKKFTKKITRKVQQPFKYVSKKAPEIKKLTAVAATIPGPQQAITVPVAAGAQLIPEKVKKRVPARVVQPAPTAKGVGTQTVIKYGLPILGAGLIAYLAASD